MTVPQYTEKNMFSILNLGWWGMEAFYLFLEAVCPLPAVQLCDIGNIEDSSALN